MRRTVILLLLACGALLAQEDGKARARALEIEAGKALEEGRRGDALKLLDEAADAREGKAAAPKPPPAPPGATELLLMDDALKRGDAAAALEAGRRARDALAAWAKDLEARARGVEDLTVEERLERAEKRIEELRRRYGR